MTPKKRKKSDGPALIDGKPEERDRLARSIPLDEEATRAALAIARQSIADIVIALKKCDLYLVGDATVVDSVDLLVHRVLQNERQNDRSLHQGRRMTDGAVDVVELLRTARFRYSSENDLQMGIALLLVEHGLAFEREAQLTPGSRIDFLVDGGVGIEVKIGGSVSELGYQILRYLEHERVTAMIVVTTRATHRDLPTEMEGKKVHVVHLYSSAF